jgi:hypothetical protein
MQVIRRLMSELSVTVLVSEQLLRAVQVAKNHVTISSAVLADSAALKQLNN